MPKVKRYVFAGVLCLAATVILSEDALSGCIKCGAANPGKGCNQLVTVKHPDLKGPERKKEWNKCMSDPDSYGK